MKRRSILRGLRLLAGALFGMLAGAVFAQGSRAYQPAEWARIVAAAEKEG